MNNANTNITSYNKIVTKYNNDQKVLSQKDMHKYYEQTRELYNKHNAQTMPVPPKDYSYDRYARVFAESTTD